MIEGTIKVKFDEERLIQILDQALKNAKELRSAGKKNRTSQTMNLLNDIYSKLMKLPIAEEL